MAAFLRSLDHKTWKSIIIGWFHPKVTSDDGKEVLKPSIEWFGAEDEASLGNSHTLKAIFNRVD